MPKLVCSIQPVCLRVKNLYNITDKINLLYYNEVLKISHINNNYQKLRPKVIL